MSKAPTSRARLSPTPARIGAAAWIRPATSPRASFRRARRRCTGERGAKPRRSLPSSLPHRRAPRRLAPGFPCRREKAGSWPKSARTSPTIRFRRLRRTCSDGAWGVAAAALLRRGGRQRLLADESSRSRGRAPATAGRRSRSAPSEDEERNTGIFSASWPAAMTAVDLLGRQLERRFRPRLTPRHAADQLIGDRRQEIFHVAAIPSGRRTAVALGRGSCSANRSALPANCSSYLGTTNNC